MIAKTGTMADCLTDPSDGRLYLHWDSMTWNINGDVKTVNISVDEMCREDEDLTVMIFPGNITLRPLPLAIIESL